MAQRKGRRTTNPVYDVTDSPDTPGVIAPPPLIYLAFILLGLAVDVVAPLRAGPSGLGTPAGIILIIGALVLFASALREFKRAETPVETRKPTTAIIRTGPYRYTRNPIYLAMTALHLGIAFWVGSVWLFATLVLAVIVVSTGVIAREERYLIRRFGDDYTSYKASVRRWL